MSQDKVIERLLAHAELCRHIAAASWSEEIARELEQLADDCRRAAEVAESNTGTYQFIPKPSASTGN